MHEEFEGEHFNREDYTSSQKDALRNVIEEAVIKDKGKDIPPSTRVKYGSEEIFKIYDYIGKLSDRLDSVESEYKSLREKQGKEGEILEEIDKKVENEEYEKVPVLERDLEILRKEIQNLYEEKDFEKLEKEYDYLHAKLERIHDLLEHPNPRSN